MQWPLLEGVPQETVSEVLAIARRRTFVKGEIVFHQGDAANSLHLIVKGRVAIRTPTRMGDVALLDVLGSGAVFGEMALVTPDGIRSATAAALEPTETFAVYRDEFARLRAAHPSVTDVLLAIVASRLRQANERIAIAHYLDADDRVLWSLQRLAQVFGDETGSCTIKLTQEQIAELAGTARATVNRVLREQQERGTIELTRGAVRILDLGPIEKRLRRFG